MGRTIYVTGMGIITALGKNLAETFDALLNCRSGISNIRYIDTIHKDKIPVAQIPYSNEQLADMLGVDIQNGYTRGTLLAMIATAEALKTANITNTQEIPTGFISANTVGGMDFSEIYYYDYLKEKKKNPFIETHDCAAGTEKTADFYGLNAFVSTVSTACSSAANAILLGARLIQSGLLKRVVAGGTECLSKFHLNGFHSLKILDSKPCRPFDKNRAGINLGEGAGYVVLESEETAFDRKREYLFLLSGWSNACEAYHQTASSPEGDGAFLAMKKALDMSQLKPSDIDYINAHGTGTDNNDLSEGKAIERIFGTQIPPVSSVKPFTGHTTSAAGAVESIIALLGMKNNILWPNLNFSEQMPELSFKPITTLLTHKPQKHIMKNSFGFGGNNTTLIFSNVNNKH